MASPFHGVGDFEHHHFAMTTNPAKVLQNITHTISLTRAHKRPPNPQSLVSYMTVARFKALMADLNADGAEVVASAPRAQVPLLLASEWPLFRRIGEGLWRVRTPRRSDPWSS